MPSDPKTDAEERSPPDAPQVIGQPHGFYELLEAIRKRPGMYRGHKSLVALRYWLHGYYHANFEAGIAPSAEEEEFADFDDFVCRKYRWHDVGGWAAKIAYKHRGAAEAQDEFFKLFNEFRVARRSV